MQTELAMAIFERVFGKPEASRYRLVATIDWSMNHAAKPEDGLDATAMNVNPGGLQPHMRSTVHPPVYRPPMAGGANSGVGLPTLVRRPYTCELRCPLCMTHLARAKEAGIDLQQDYQAIGRKGLKQVLIERGAFQHWMVQKDMVHALQQFTDFSPKSDHERARVTEMMRSRGHVALFGVKYHAELAHIERKWMRLKQRIRPKLDGKLGKLRKLLEQFWPKYEVHEARRAARHCRETMRAYVELGDAATLDQLQDAQKKQKAHRKVIDSADGILKLKANLVMTEEDRGKTENLATWSSGVRWRSSGKLKST